jgi:hypothetical protein
MPSKDVFPQADDKSVACRYAICRHAAASRAAMPFAAMPSDRPAPFCHHGALGWPRTKTAALGETVALQANWVAHFLA